MSSKWKTLKICATFSTSNADAKLAVKVMTIENNVTQQHVLFQYLKLTLNLKSLMWMASIEKLMASTTTVRMRFGVKGE